MEPPRLQLSLGFSEGVTLCHPSWREVLFKFVIQKD